MRMDRLSRALWLGGTNKTWHLICGTESLLSRSPSGRRQSTYRTTRIKMRSTQNLDKAWNAHSNSAINPFNVMLGANPAFTSL